VGETLVELLGALAGEVREQRPIEIFWATLVELVSCHRVRLDTSSEGYAPLIGKLHSGIRRQAYAISSELALMEVQKCLRDQARPQLPLRARDIVQQLQQEGKLSSEMGNTQVRIEGQSKRCFVVDKVALFADPEDIDSEPVVVDEAALVARNLARKDSCRVGA